MNRMTKQQPLVAHLLVKQPVVFGYSAYKQVTVFNRTLT